MSTQARFPERSSAGRLFWSERSWSLDESVIEWVGEAQGEVELPDDGYVGIVLTTDPELRRRVIAELDTTAIQMVYFRNPFELRSLLDDLFPEITQHKLIATDNMEAQDEDCELLCDLPGLRAVDVSSSSISDRGLARLAEILTLEYLNVADTRITDEGLKSLADLSGLRQLDLSLNAITDDGLSYLSRMQLLEDLGLADVPVTDLSVPLIAGFSKLTFLNISDTAISPQGKIHLASSLPDCDVWDG